MAPDCRDSGGLRASTITVDGRFDVSRSRSDTTGPAGPVQREGDDGRSTHEVHEEVAALVDDAVVSLIVRAIRPTLDPFRVELTGLTTSLQHQVDGVGELLGDDAVRREQLQGESRELLSGLAEHLAAVTEDLAGHVSERLGALEPEVRALSHVQHDANGSIADLGEEARRSHAFIADLCHRQSERLGQLEAQVETVVETTHRSGSSLFDALGEVRRSQAVIIDLGHRRAERLGRVEAEVGALLAAVDSSSRTLSGIGDDLNQLRRSVGDQIVSLRRLVLWSVLLTGVVMLFVLGFGVLPLLAG